MRKLLYCFISESFTLIWNTFDHMTLPGSHFTQPINYYGFPHNESPHQHATIYQNTTVYSWWCGVTLVGLDNQSVVSIAHFWPPKITRQVDYRDAIRFSMMLRFCNKGQVMLLKSESAHVKLLLISILNKCLLVINCTNLRLNFHCIK